MAFKLFSRTGPAPQPTGPQTKSKRKWRYFVWSLVVIVVGFIGWIGISGFLAFKNISSENNNEDPSFLNSSGDINPDALKTEGSGRVNILVAGMGGASHPGGNLTDSLQVISIDPINKTMAMLSIPRDLYVTKPSGGKGKINEVNTDGEAYCRLKGCATGVDGGGAAMKETVSGLLEIPIQYFVRLDFQGFQKIVDSLGGIDVYVDKAINDPFYPDTKLQGYDPFYVAAGLKKFDGKTALKYARSRETTSDFDRARRQQQVLSAIREKALSTHVLTNPKKITDLFTILGTNIKTDLKADEMVKLASLVNQLDNSKTVSDVLDTAADSPLKSLTDPRAGYIIVPKKGLNDFSEVREFVGSIFKEPYVLREAATVAIINNSGTVGLEKSVNERLTALGYKVVSATAGPKVQVNSTVTNNKTKPYSSELLRKRFGATFAASSSSDSANITVILGSKYKLK